jgi:type IV secretory pathway ATPase VirB11/archaellum biosynthesis ATPase
MSLVEVLQAGNMPPRLAAMFWLAMERGASLIIAAGPPSAGKTATLTALLSLTPPESVAYFTRGLGETFSLPPRTDAHPTYILVNEMSDDLPVYTWDGHARRVFELMAEGYSLATTVHADTVDGVLAILQEEIGVPRDQIGKLTFVVPLRLIHDGPGGARSLRRRVSEVAFFEPDGEDGFSRRRLARWDADADSFAILEADEDRQALARWCGLSSEELLREMDRREAFLSRLLKNGTSSIRAVNAAIERFYAEEIRARPSG